MRAVHAFFQKHVLLARRSTFPLYPPLGLADFMFVGALLRQSFVGTWLNNLGDAVSFQCTSGSLPYFPLECAGAQAGGALAVDVVGA